MNRSPFFYVGDKYKLIRQLKKNFPSQIETFFEPFVGGGSVFLNVEAKKFKCNDKNKSMIDLHKFLYSYKDRKTIFFKEIENMISYYKLSASYLGKVVDDEMKKKYVKTYYAHYNKSAYYQLRNDFNENSSNLFRLYLLLIYGFNHMIRFNKNGMFNLPVGNVDYNKNVVNSLNNYFDFVKNNDISFSDFDFEVFLDNAVFKENDFVYFDPPYLISSSEYNKNWTLDEEKRLLAIIDKLNENGVRFALSNVFYHKNCSNDLLIEWSKKYKVTKIKSNYISYHDNRIKETLEVLITNY